MSKTARVDDFLKLAKRHFDKADKGEDNELGLLMTVGVGEGRSRTSMASFKGCKELTLAE